MTLETTRFASTQLIAKCPGEIPFFSACAFTFCAIASDSPRNSVSRMRLSLRPTRESAGGKDLDLGPAIHHVVVGLADDGLRDAEPLAPAHDLGDAPAAIVRHAEVA